VEDLRHRTARMSDEQLARTLASGLRGRTNSPRHDPPPELARFGPRKTSTARKLRTAS